MTKPEKRGWSAPVEPDEENSGCFGLLAYYLILWPLYTLYRTYLWVMTGKWEEP